MDKPAFDSSQPFQEVQGQKPLFNPNQPFQQVAMQKPMSEEQIADAAEAQDEALQDKYGGVGQTLKAFAEGAGRGASFGTSTAAERAAGVNPEDIKGREEANPIASTIGEIAGIAGSALTGIGEGAAVERAGSLAARALGLGGEGAVSKIGSTAAKMAVENALVQGGNEVHKYIEEDPNQSAGSAVANIGLSSLIGLGGGAAFGAVSPLWKATAGKQLGTLSELISNRVNGKAIPLTPEIEQAITSSGIELTPDIRAGLSKVPMLENSFNTLREATTQPAQDLQQSLFNFRKTAADEVVGAFGKTPDQIPEAISHYEAGHVLQEDLAKTIEDKVKPISEGFNQIRDTFKKIPLTQQDDVIADRLAQLGSDQGWNIPSMPQTKLLNDTLKDLPHVKTLEDLRNYQSNIWSKAQGDPGLFNSAGKIVGVLRDVESQALERAAGEKGANTLMKLQLARSAYKDSADLIETLNDRLHVGKYGGPESFTRALREMPPETVLNRLSKGNDVGLMNVLQKEFPEISARIKDYQVNKILASAASKAPEGMAVNTKKVFDQINKMTPEMKAFVLSGESGQKLQGIETLLNSVPEYKSSWTARHQENLWGSAPQGVAGFVSWLTGHGLGQGLLVGSVGKWLIRDAPDAVRYMLLKFLGSSGSIEPSAMKGVVNFAAAVIKGEHAMSKGIDSLFKAGAAVLPRQYLGDDKSNQKLDKKIQSLAQNPESLMNTGGSMGSMLPDHATALSATATRAVNYLNSIRPKTSQPGMLDKPIEVSKAQQAKYDRALTIADKPLRVLENVKNGTILPEDVITLRSIHPDLYNRMSQKIMSSISTQIDKEVHIPYETRLGLGMFLGQAVDGTMTPQSIMMNQPIAAQPQQQTPKPQGQGPRNYKALSKLPASYMTTDQQRSAKRSGAS